MELRVLVLMVAGLVTAACARVETPSNPGETRQRAATPTPADLGVALAVPLKPVTPRLALSKKQRSYLNESIPSDLRDILEKSEKFEILGEVDAEDMSGSDVLIFNPNRLAVITSEELKKKVLEAFYLDAATEDSPANCYEPHHSIRATHRGEKVELEICFACASFVVRDSRKLWGTIVR